MRSKRTFTIKVVLPILFSVMAALTIFQGVMALQTTTFLKLQVDELANQRMPRVQSANDLQIIFQSVRRGTADLIIAATPDARTEAFKVLDNYVKIRDETINFIFGAITKPETARRAEELKTLVAAENAYLSDVRNHVTNGRTSEAVLIYNEAMRTIFDKEIAMVDMLKAANVRTTKDTVAAGQADYERATLTAYVTLAVAVIATAAMAFFAYRRISRPITKITEAMNILSSGNLTAEIPYGDRQDEIGAMARAVAIFKLNAVERRRLEQEADENRSLSEQERVRQEMEKAHEASEVRFAIDALGGGLTRISAGDLSVQLHEPFAERLDELRHNFNGSVDRLRTTLMAVGSNAAAISAGANEIRSAADDLSKRTEQQAASVEQTAAALEQITTTVADSTRRAENAGSLVDRTRIGAEKSGQIVTKAISAMHEIEQSSEQISNIIGVIDDIAFQTNLLALNAGVEAARAGEAGKGFAVVAQEVRELAQRSAKAAQEIRELITTSGSQVRAGVDLVSETGRALKLIVEEVQEINTHVAAIVTSAREQSNGLKEINTAVNTMDQGTQQNAAMVEQSTAASYGLAQQATALDELLAQFNLASPTRGAQDFVTGGSMRPMSGKRAA